MTEACAIIDYLGLEIRAIAQKLFPGGIDASSVWDEGILDMGTIHLPFNLKQHLWADGT